MPYWKEEMDSDERIAQGLENGPEDPASEVERGRIDAVRIALGTESVWEEPPNGLEERIATQIAPTRRTWGRWRWEVAAAVALVLATVGVMNSTGSERPDPVAVVAMIGTSLAPDAVGTASLIPTPNGWAISFEATGLPPARPNTYYEAWVDNGRDSVAVGTFHMRGGDPTPLALWSGVDLHEYRTIRVTIQHVGGGTTPSEMLVMTGTAGDFNDK